MQNMGWTASNNLWLYHPGEVNWHRGSYVCRARRVQNMGWTANNSLWLATRGGDVFFSPTPGVSEKFDQARLGSRGFGILDVACAPRFCHEFQSSSHPPEGSLGCC